MTGLCNTDGCDRVAHARGWCHVCYSRMRRTGLGNLDLTPIARFRRHYRVLGNGCWEWTGATNGKGYGVFRLHSRQVYAHRAAYELNVGALPDGLVLDHDCHNRDPICTKVASCPHRRCVNPAHLQLVTYLTNAATGRGCGWEGRQECKNSHPINEVNTYIDAYGNRSCRPCRQAASSRHYAKKRGRST